MKERNEYFTRPIQIRKNWGYWDGVAARQRGRWPEWCKGWQDMAKVHFDKAYGEGFKIGWYGETPPMGAILEPHPSR